MNEYRLTLLLRYFALITCFLFLAKITIMFQNFSSSGSGCMLYNPSNLQVLNSLNLQGRKSMFTTDHEKSVYIVTLISCRYILLINQLMLDHFNIFFWVIYHGRQAKMWRRRSPLWWKDAAVDWSLKNKNNFRFTECFPRRCIKILCSKYISQFIFRVLLTWTAFEVNLNFPNLI